MVTKKNLEGTEVCLSFEIPAEEFDNAIMAAYHNTAKYYTVPGFRKGKAPKKAIENHYGEGVFFEDALEIILDEAYDSAINEYHLQVGDSRLDMHQMEKGQPLLFDIICECPKVTLGQYKGIELNAADYVVKAEDIDEMAERKLEASRKELVRHVTVDSRPVENGDKVDIDFSGSVDGVKFDGGTAEHYELVIGSGSFIPGFEEQLIGMNIGEERDITVTFPADYHAAELAGKESVFAIKLHGITTDELPELNDDFAQDVSEFDTLDAYKASLREQAEAELKKQADERRDDDAYGKAVDNAQIEIPNALVDRKIKSELDRTFGGKMDLHQFCEMFGRNYEEELATLRERFSIQIKFEALIDAIAADMNLEPTDDDLRDHLIDVLKQANANRNDDMAMSDEEFAKSLERLNDMLADPAQRNDFVYDYVCYKARRVIVETIVLK